MKKYLELFAQAIGMRKSVKRTRNELATTKSPMASGWGRPIYSTSKEPSEDKETQTTESETEPLDIHKQYHGNPSTHTGCCGFTECRTSHDKDIYILTGKKGS
jgi:hypothetical protein